ncbi:MAG: hypothetical protein APU95_05335 [Hadesarchaea archaeon YNP_N21]|nr:MAG: hypothetical protein APU95_05335 [Hadesarchaea archaeon YNP_N21]
MRIPRVIIASPWSCSGKTTVSTGLMGALMRRGLKVQPFKIGPDFIDPSYHAAITGARSRNLDTWLMPRRAVLEVFGRAAANSDIAIIEGVMGMFDGMSGRSEATSTSEIAKILRAPVVLVLDVLNMARSAGALVLGCKVFDEKAEVKGVILNRTTSEKHARWATEAIEGKARIPVLGALPYDESLRMPERHLGLIPSWEKGSLEKFFQNLVRKIESNIDIESIQKIAKSAGNFHVPMRRVFPEHKIERRVEIGVAFDEAFNFYYWDNLEILESCGAGIKFFSPIHDKDLPKNIQGMYIGGGFPEVLAEEISKNESMKKGVRMAIDDEMPVYAECGGLMYLMKSVLDFEGKGHRMVGMFEGIARMGKKLEALDYTLAKVVDKNPISETGKMLKGHEFHFSSIEGLPSDSKFAYKMLRGRGIAGGKDGLLEKNCLASYMHLHFAQDPRLARNFVRACELYKIS